MMRRQDVVAGLAAGVAAGVAGAAFLPSRVVAAGVSPAEAEVKALFAREARRRRSLCRGGTAEVGAPAREALGVGAVDVRQPPHSTFKIWNTLIALETGAAPTPGSSNAMTGEYPARTGGRRTWLDDAGERIPALGVGAGPSCGGGGDANPALPAGLRQRRTSPAGSTASGSAAVADFPAPSGSRWPCWRGWRAGAVQPGARGDPAADHGAGPGRGAGRFRARPGSVNWAWAGSRPVQGAGSRAGSLGLARAGGPDLRLRHLHGRDAKTFGPHRIAHDPAGAGVAGRAAGSDGAGRGRRQARASPQPLIKSFRNLRRGGREGCQAATGWLLAARLSSAARLAVGTGAGVAIVP